MGAARALAKPVKRSEIVRAVAELAGPPGTVQNQKRQDYRMTGK